MSLRHPVLIPCLSQNEPFAGPTIAGLLGAALQYQAHTLKASLLSHTLEGSLSSHTLKGFLSSHALKASIASHKTLVHTYKGT